MFIKFIQRISLNIELFSYQAVPDIVINGNIYNTNTHYYTEPYIFLFHDKESGRHVVESKVNRRG